MERSSIIVKKPFKGLIHLVFPSQFDLTSTFIRFQEFYESPNAKFRGRHFTLDEVMDDYVARFSLFSYLEDWNGFNMPGQVFDWAVFVFGDDIRPKEAILRDVVYEHLDSHPYYVIATHGAYDCEKHEIAHALYSLDNAYKIQVDMFIAQIEPPKKSLLIKWLLEEGYCLPVINDEINSYLMDALAGYERWAEFLVEPQIKLAAENLTLLFNQRLEHARLSS
jgi:hypothetical protein